ncbi:AraC-type DNA-binding protein [Chitinophaga rupis]|uniref:AraC-type DNA-binding protein n=1 Tax=Chitinophaga rupis TaxID=573321 RepID=A0A1H7XY37_9BACT|nr:AraC family transcriptional regulator [Chitinophaga rupis]SEM38534.1 AraC-type DNA-binding protein [Chitinophaga rupis]
MNKLIYQSLKISPGKPVPIPQALYSNIASWADAEYQEYNFGHVLTQTLLYKLFRIYILRFRMKQPATVPLYSQQPAICMLYCLNGAAEVIIGDTTFIVKRDQFGFIYIPKGTHLLQPEEETELFIIDLEASFLEELAASIGEIKSLVALSATQSDVDSVPKLFTMNYVVRYILEDMRRCRETEGGLLMELRTANVQLMNLYRKAYNEDADLKKLPTQANLDIIDQIYGEIKQNPNIQQHTVSYFTRKYSISESTLGRFFSAAFKKGLHEFVAEECIKKADWLLSTYSISTEDVAQELGYADKSGFIKAYKRYRGITPKQLKI